MVWISNWFLIIKKHLNGNGTGIGGNSFLMYYTVYSTVISFQDYKRHFMLVVFDANRHGVSKY